ncbi:hypothetical protein HMPREF0645_2657 [Hallella bergensis DSM 17361]|uniref:HTH cro/C1-type domain-containing protein n=1 Tax=Hallella bergensis DSM 17361 TaxID=585502 RepID=D1Q0C2_9BACT|nr:helix-turn-helix transcriptional regulator [Hallella bergensis]EFA42907.1 hypothetical protein HMPREF0645_2657 [Hallella bergensis DSM 17361]
MDIYIKDVIKAKGLQLQQVAERIGYKSLPSFYRQINSPESISMKTLLKIADSVGCKVNDFFFPPSEKIVNRNNFLAIVKYNGELKEVTSVEELEKIVGDLKKEEK